MSVSHFSYTHQDQASTSQFSNIQYRTFNEALDKVNMANIAIIRVMAKNASLKAKVTCLEAENARLRAISPEHAEKANSGDIWQRGGKESTSQVESEASTWQPQDHNDSDTTIPSECDRSDDEGSVTNSTAEEESISGEDSTSEDDCTSESGFTDATSSCGSDDTSGAILDDWNTGATTSNEVKGDWDNSSPELPKAETQRSVDIVDAYLETNELAKKIQLGSDFYRRDECIVRVDSERLKHFTHAAHSTAQQVIYRAWRLKYPNERVRFWDSAGYVDLQFGQLTGLCDAFAHGASTCFGDSFKARREVVARALRDIHGVRNAWAHAGYITSFAMDGLLYAVQRLAIVMEDEAAAVKMQRLRQQLHREAATELAHIKCGFTEAKRPPPHIERTFDDCFQALERGEPQFPDFVCKEAFAWREAHGLGFASDKVDSMAPYYTKPLHDISANPDSLALMDDIANQVNKEYGREHREHVRSLMNITIEPQW